MSRPANELNIIHDSVTVLKSAGPLLAKVWNADGSIDPYQDAKNFRVKEYAVSGVRELAGLLESIRTDPRKCVIRGGFVGAGSATGSEMPDHWPRLNANFADRPLHMLMIDVDAFHGTVQDYVLTLPPEFHGATYYWQMSGSAGHSKNVGVLKCHLWFWLRTPYDGAQLKAWAIVNNVPLDKSVLRQVQVHYTADPVFSDGVADPIDVRTGVEEGFEDAVDLEIPQSVLDVASKYTTSREGDAREYTDPKEKKGIIGAFCRAFTMDDLLAGELSEVFERVDGSDRRLNYLIGRGAGGGAYVTDDGEYIGNTHDSDPFHGRIANKWDLVRVYKFGHMDKGADPFALMDLRTTPSQIAMQAWAEGLDEIKAKTAEGRADRVTGYLARIDETPTVQELEEFIGPDISADNQLSDIEREQLARAAQARAAVLIGHRPPIAIARGWVAPEAGFPDTGEGGGVLGTVDNVRVVLRQMGTTVRYNTMTKKREILIPRAAYSPAEYDNAAFARLTSECAAVGMPTVNLKAYVTLIASENPYNPVAEWIHSKEWDGVSRLEEFYTTLVVRPEHETLKKLVLSKWLLSTVRAGLAADGAASRGVLVLAGDQYIGKTKWIRRLAPDHMVRDGHTMNLLDKDSVLRAINRWIVELGELDATFRKSDLSALKAFTTQGEDTIRLPYAVEASQFPRQTSFAASVNDEHYLHDETGNTRFWTVPVLSIDYDHKIDMQQLWAEMESRLNDGEQCWMTPEEMITLEAHNDDFVAKNPIWEKLDSDLAWGSKQLEWKTATQILESFGYKNIAKVQTNSVGAYAKKRGLPRRKGAHGTRLIQIPGLRSEEFEAK